MNIRWSIFRKVLMCSLALSGASALALATPANHQPIGGPNGEDTRASIVVNGGQAAHLLPTRPPVWLEQKITASDGVASEYFGRSVALEGDLALVGIANRTINGHESQGAVYVYKESNGTWTLAQRLTANDGAAGDHFGFSVAISGTTAVIGARTATAGQGKVYVFTESGGVWSRAQELSASDGAAGDQFGWSVALDGTTVIVGAPTSEYFGIGAAYVFAQQSGIWSQVQKLVASDDDIYEFGWAVAVDGANALVGADCGYDPSLQDCDYNRAYAFAETDGVWNQIPIQYGGGTSVALSGTTAVTGEEPFYFDGGYDWSQGTIKIWTGSNDAWTENSEFEGDWNGFDDFGISIAISGNRIFVGADYDIGDYYCCPAPGSVYEYTKSNGTWIETRTFAASDAAGWDHFGNAVAVSGGTILVGAMGNNSYQGAAYFYGESDLDFALSAPESVGQGQTYVNQTIATNNASAASPAVTATIMVPAAASFVSATASQGSCGEASGVVTCDFGAIVGNGGTATANVTLKAIGNVGDTIENTASVAHATPALGASASTTITEAGACPESYTEYDGSLNPGGTAHAPTYQAPAGAENAILTGPSGFQLYLVFQNAQYGRKVYRIPGNEVHRQAPAGSFTWAVKAGDAGGAYTLCILHP